jgi:mono/diheme cytochrome c family protein
MTTTLILALWAAADPAGGFDRAVRPILAAHCVRCHSGARPRAGLDLSSATTAFAGSKAGPVVTAGNTDLSLIVQVLSPGHDTHMPPDGQLSDVDIAAIKAWVTALPPAVVAKRKELQVTDQDRRHWAFQPPRPVTPPAGPRHPIDAFLVQRLRAQNLGFAAPAERRALLRRLAFDLVGLPPTPEQSEAFVTDPAPDAYEKQVDRLLASPHYGERWARHWLDLARYADAAAEPGDAPTGGAHHYRDYVIRSLNTDKPFDRFITEQLAGDLANPGDRDALVATGFLRLGLPGGAAGERARYDDLDDMAGTSASVFLGLTVGCARCHDHKTDPIPARDYYRLAAVFAGTERRSVPVPTEPQRRDLAAAHAQRDAELSALREKLTALDAPADDEREEDEVGAPDFVGPPAPSRWSMRRQREADELRRRIAERESEQPIEPTAVVAGEAAAVAPVHLLLRGDPKAKGEAVAPGVLQVLAGGDGALPADRPSRLALARWLARPDHPLTARVIVNRVWAQHFGRGLVATPSNFGPAGEPPTHPELLDWLAADFVRGGWSLKKLHRLIVTSDTYRQSSAPADAAQRLDPDNRLLSRYPRRRLDAEAIRDALLSTSGRLNPVMYGPGARGRPGDANLAPEAARSALAVREGPQQARRSVYLFVSRSSPSVLLESFDAPPPACACDRRTATTVPPQALLLLNAPFVLEQADALARRVKRDAGPDPAAQVDRLYRVALGRPPQPDETARALRFLAEPSLKVARPTRKGADDPGPLADLAHVVLNLNEFVYVD